VNYIKFGNELIIDAIILKVLIIKIIEVVESSVNGVVLRSLKRIWKNDIKNL
jgi:hypothetical protein